MYTHTHTSLLENLKEDPLLEVTELDVSLPNMIPLTPMTTFILLNGTEFKRIESYLYSIVS